MKIKLLTSALWIVRIMLAALLLFWAAELLNVVFAYSRRGPQGIREYLVHSLTTGMRFPSAMGDAMQITRLAYEVLIFYILLTWLLRELHSWLHKRVKHLRNASSVQKLTKS